jgi:hypothetical protein
LHAPHVLVEHVEEDGVEELPEDMGNGRVARDLRAVGLLMARHVVP